MGEWHSRAAGQGPGCPPSQEECTPAGHTMPEQRPSATTPKPERALLHLVSQRLIPDQVREVIVQHLSLVGTQLQVQPVQPAPPPHMCSVSLQKSLLPCMAARGGRIGLSGGCFLSGPARGWRTRLQLELKRIGGVCSVAQVTRAPLSLCNLLTQALLHGTIQGGGVED